MKKMNLTQMQKAMDYDGLCRDIITLNNKIDDYIYITENFGNVDEFINELIYLIDDEQTTDKHGEYYTYAYDEIITTNELYRLNFLRAKAGFEYAKDSIKGVNKMKIKRKISANST